MGEKKHLSGLRYLKKLRRLDETYDTDEQIRTHEELFSPLEELRISPERRGQSLRSIGSLGFAGM